MPRDRRGCSGTCTSPVHGPGPRTCACWTGTSLAGGRGSIGGTIIGAFVIGVLGDGLVMMGVSEFWQMVIKGLVIIAAVVLDQLQRRASMTTREA